MMDDYESQNRKKEEEVSRRRCGALRKNDREAIALNTIDINPRDKEILFSLLALYLPRTTVWAYGSRVTGHAQPWSDLDLVVFSGAEEKPRLSLLKEALDESNLSFRVDLLEWDSLPENFKMNISSSPTAPIKFD